MNGQVMQRTDVIGYLGLVLNLSSMAMKNLMSLRVLAVCANVVYVLYGVLLHAMPFIIGCAIAIGIHAYHIYKLKKNGKENCSTKG